MGIPPSRRGPLLRRPSLRVFEGDRLPRLVRGQPPQHPSDRTDPDPSLARPGGPLIVLAVTPIPPQPGEAPFRHPTFRQLHEPLGALRALHCLDLEGLLPPPQPRVERMVPVLPVAPDRPLCP